MKILGKVFIILAILAIVLVPVAGCTGSEGLQGTEGPTGPQGPTGSTGSQGPEGPEGPTGPQGATGPQGPTGSTGSQGPQGLTGATGAQGAAGPAGSTGAAGPAGPQGPTGIQGLTGIEGPEGPAGPVRQIVVTWDPYDHDIYFGPMSSIGAVEAYPGQRIRIKGSGFNPDDIIILTICENDIILTETIANNCGAFEAFAYLPSVPPLLHGPVSVKAWVDTDNNGFYEKQSSWPLDIVTKADFVSNWYEWWSFWAGPILL